MTDFCKHLTSGLVYNNEISRFDLAPCCYFSDSQPVDIDTTPEDLGRIRRSWIMSDLNQTCKICLDHERSGLYSYRQSSFDIMPGSSSKIQFLTVAVNKKCNLACATCGSHSSSFWYQENVRNGVAESPATILMHAEDRQRITTEKFLALLSLTDLNELVYVKFGGGEPLMSDTHERIMAMIPDPGRVTIQYTSNFSIMPNAKTLELWQRMKLVKWVASLDGVGDRFFFLRWPYQWQNLESFVARAQQAVPPNVMFGVEHTINPLNIFYFDEFQRWFDQQFSQNRYGDASDFNLHACHGVMSLNHTPPALRAVIKDRYGAQHAVTNLLEQHPWSGSAKDMIQYLDNLCAQRNLDWRQTFSEVQEFFPSCTG